MEKGDYKKQFVYHSNILLQRKSLQSSEVADSPTPTSHDVGAIPEPSSTDTIALLFSGDPLKVSQFYITISNVI